MAVRRMLVVVALVAIAGCGDGDDATTTRETTTTTETTTSMSGTSTTGATSTTEADGELALSQTCSFSEVGFEVEVAYPQGWQTNRRTEFEHGTVPACRVFHHRAIELPRPNELTAYDVFVAVDAVGYERAVGSGERGAEVLEESTVVVGGRDGRRREVRLTEAGIQGPEGARVTTWVVDLDGSILVARTHEVADLDYERNRQVLDTMVGALSLTPTGS